MFRARPSEIHSPISLTAMIALGSLVLVFVLSLTAVYQVFDEYVLLTSWQARLSPVSVDEIETLRRDIGTRIIVRSIATTLLALCAFATLWLLQRQYLIRRSLYQIKLFASDVLASMDQGVITTDASGTITSVNSAAIHLLGSELNCVGQPLVSIPLTGARLSELAWLVRERKECVWDYDFNVDRSGHVHWIRADGHVLKDAEGGAMGCLLLLRDVSDRLMMEDRLRRMERFLSLGHLASGLHHEIKNPLTALSIHVQLLEKRLRDSDTKRPVDELLEVVKSEVVRLNRVLDSFHDFANLQGMARRPTEVLDILEQIVKLFGPQAQAQKVDVTLFRPLVKLPSVAIDVEKFKQAILNLVINALEAMPAGGTLWLAARCQNGSLVIDVTDSGQGIPPSIQADIFKPYFSTKDRGTGMGLALTEKLVGQHDGRIEFKTGPRGTTFSIVIPLESRTLASNGAR